jgi:hypothetical protein
MRSTQGGGGWAPSILPTGFSPAAKERSIYWRGITPTSEVTDEDRAFLTWTETERYVSVRVPGKRNMQEVSAEVRTAEINAARVRMRTDGGGVASTESTHQTYRRIFLQACREMGITEGQEFDFSTETFGELGAWCLIGINIAKLDVFTTMLNKEREVSFNDYSRPWYKHPKILKIKKKYEIEKHKDDQAFALAHPEAVKELRVSIPGNTIQEIVVEGEQLMLDGREEATEKLGHIATILMTLLFVIRASTVGGMFSEKDIWLDENGHLCMTIRFIKCWVTGRQKSTGKKLPIERVGRDSIPPGEGPDHPRSRAFAIIMEAKRRTSICWIPGPAEDRPYRAVKDMTEMMEGYGWNLVALGRKASSHSGRKTGVSALDNLTNGGSRSQIMEWMLVTDVSLVARCCEREYIVTSFVAEMFDWMTL